MKKILHKLTYAQNPSRYEAHPSYYEEILCKVSSVLALFVAPWRDWITSLADGWREPRGEACAAPHAAVPGGEQSRIPQLAPTLQGVVADRDQSHPGARAVSRGNYLQCCTPDFASTNTPFYPWDNGGASLIPDKILLPKKTFISTCAIDRTTTQTSPL